MSTVARWKRLVAKRGRAIVLLLAVVSILALGSAGWAVANPPSEQVTDHQAQERFSVTTGTSAVVTGESRLYDRGDRIENRSLYPLAAAPNLTLSLQSSLPPGATATHQLTLVLEGTRDGDPFWRAERELLNQTVTDGAVTTATINVSAVAQRLRAARNEVGTAGEFSARVELNTTYRSDRYEGTLNASAPLGLTGTAYWLEASLDAEQTEARTVSRTVTQPRDPVAVGGLAFLGVCALLGAGGLHRYHRQLDTETVETEVTHSRYDEWISEGEFPSDQEKRYVRIESLRDLVNVAIDSNKRVIYDDVYRAYAVADGDLVYYFTTDIDRIAPWLNM